MRCNRPSCDRPITMMCDGRRIFKNACKMLLFIKRKEFRMNR